MISCLRVEKCCDAGHLASPCIIDGVFSLSEVLFKETNLLKLSRLKNMQEIRQSNLKCKHQHLMLHYVLFQLLVSLSEVRFFGEKPGP